jgi:aminoglycoside phosphotransferase (APT) family kinase protein
MTRLPGQPLAEVTVRLAGDDLATIYGEMGELLAAVHRIPQDHWGYLTTRAVDTRPTNTAYMTDQFERRLSAFAQLGGEPVLTRAVGAYVARHRGLFAACTAAVLCHNDYHQGNVLVWPAGDRWRVAGYVDVEGAVAADPLFDLARSDYFLFGPAVHSTPAVSHGDVPTARSPDRLAQREAFLRGYGPLPPGWEARVRLYQLHHALELWNWAASIGKTTDTVRARADLEALLLTDPA